MAEEHDIRWSRIIFQEVRRLLFFVSNENRCSTLRPENQVKWTSDVIRFPSEIEPLERTA